MEGRIERRREGKRRDGWRLVLGGGVELMGKKELMEEKGGLWQSK